MGMSGKSVIVCDIGGIGRKGFFRRVGLANGNFRLSVLHRFDE